MDVEKSMNEEHLGKGEQDTGPRWADDLIIIRILGKRESIPPRLPDMMTTARPASFRFRRARTRRLTASLFRFSRALCVGGVLLLAAVGCRKTEREDGERIITPAAGWPIFRGDPALTGFVRGGLPETLTPADRLEAGDEIDASPIVAGGRLYAATIGGAVIAFDLKTKRKIWRHEAPDGFTAAPLLLSREKLIIAGGQDGSVYALDADSGAVRWKRETEGKIAGSANFVQAGGRTTVLVGSWDFSLYAFDAVHGDPLWRLPTANYVNGTPAVSDIAAVFGGCDSHIRFIDCVHGMETGAVDTGAYIAGSAALADGVAYVGNYAGLLLAVETASRRIIWKYRLHAEGKGFEASPALAGPYLVIGGKDGFLYCFTRAEGRLVWKHRGGDEYKASCISDGRRVLAVSADGELSLLDLAGGRLLSSCRLGAEITASPAAAEGIIAVAGRDGMVYIFHGE